MLLAGGDGHALGAEASGAEGVEGSGGEKGAGPGVGEQEGAARESDSFAEGAEVGEGALTHDDGVARARGAHGGGNAGDPSVRGGVGLVPEAQDFVADLRGSKVVDVDRGIGAGVVGAARFSRSASRRSRGSPARRGRGSSVCWRARRSAATAGLTASHTVKPSASTRRPASWVGAPPPVAMTTRVARVARARARPSSWRNAASPCSLKMAGIERPAPSSMRVSVSTKDQPRRSARRRPTLDLPLPERPTRKMWSGMGVQPEWARGPSVRRWCSTLARISARLSPPNFSSQASARTIATIASATTPAAGTTQTSLRS